MFRYSLSDVLIATAAVGVGLAITAYFGPVFGGYYALLLTVGYASVFIPRRARLMLLACALAVAIAPVLGAGTTNFALPGSGEPLPQLRFLPLQIVARPFYLLGAGTLQLVAGVCGEDFRTTILFARSPRVQPFIVFVFWLGIAATLATPLAIT